MNVFYTNSDPIIAAQDHTRVHRNKMIVEYAQLLSTAHHELGVNADGIYKRTHLNHPSAVWVRKSPFNYDWVARCALELCRLYTIDTGKTHKTHALVIELLCNKPTAWANARDCDIQGFSEPPVAAPDEFKALAVFNGAAIAYQAYLRSKFAEWQSRAKPIAVSFTHQPEWI